MFGLFGRLPGPIGSVFDHVSLSHSGLSFEKGTKIFSEVMHFLEHTVRTMAPRRGNGDAHAHDLLLQIGNKEHT